MKLTQLAGAAAALSVVAASPMGGGHHHKHHDNLAPLYTPPNVFSEGASDSLVSAFVASSSSSSSNEEESHIIPDSYIVVMKPEHSHRLPFHLSQLEKRIKHMKDHLMHSTTTGHFIDEIVHQFDIQDMKGYAGRFSAATLDFIRAHPAVDFVERDTVVKAFDVENGAPWGLARISHRPPLRLSTLGKYEYAHDGGAGVDVYVVDTGVNIHHVELEGRAKWGKTMPQNDVDEDGNGHGSHVAGTIASRQYGVAKAANIIAVKVLGSGGSGSMSDVVGGVAWAAASAAKKAASASASKDSTHKGSVANMSLGGGKSAALDLAVNNAVKKGLHFAVAAGNDNRDACSYSPAGAENAITVGASTIGDDRAYFSNFGKCVDIFAPGLNILSIWNSGPRSTNKISGTSMASPHIAGLTAYYLSLYPSGEFVPTAEDYKSAGVTVPNSAEERAELLQAEERERNLFQKGRQLVFGGLFGGGAKKYMLNSGDDSSSKPLDPRVLKKAMLRLASKGLLSQIPSDGTPNLLAFNNFTKSAGGKEDVIINEEAEEEEEEHAFRILPIPESMEKGAKQAYSELEEMVEGILAEDLAWLARAQ